MTFVRRARVALGTLVEMRVEGLSEADATRAIDAAFAEVLAVHRLMSFHAPDSDLGRLHAAPLGEAVSVDARTFAVLAIAQDISTASRGVFDVSIGAPLVRLGLLPHPRSAYRPNDAATWRDIELLAADRVRLRRPLWIDLGGIAKGFAVDRAIDILVRNGATHATVNAGGDMRVHGARAEPIFLRIGSGVPRLPALELANAAIATSAGDAHSGSTSRPHLHGSTGIAVTAGAVVSVIAARCVVADALTKVVLAGDTALSARVLAAFGAEASVFDPAQGWSRLGCAA
jgi:FAD:protein FMN transferase